MILVMQNNQIVGIDKSLLNFLNIDLHNLSETINKIELEIAALQNKQISINNKNIKVIKVDLITLEDLSLYEIIPSNEAEVEKTSEEPLIQTSEELETIKPIEIETPQINLDEYVPITPDLQKEEIPIIEEIDQNQETSPKIELEEELFNIKPDIKPQEETISELESIVSQTKETIPVPESSEILPPKEEIQEPVTISISFEDELSEVQEILNLPKEEAKKLIEEEVKQAAKELGIDENMTKELLVDLYKQIENEKENFQKALNEKNYEELHKVAHKLKGAALNLRLSKLAYILKVIDEKSKQKAAIDTLKELVNKFYEFFDKINDRPKVNISPEIREIIMKTVQDYLETQNEKKFKKDKKYIEKLLNQKIDSIDDLKNILKG
ncbi:Hpt domain-containing protein [Caminibacter pacificus]|uniref:Hpt domain-containing protein n=1 Tax=Caminibacter pacificus TaxID=1424653 RepID=A0AAJ4RBV0_9BACT|nr:Hpt domain-containing protein [Caminibacter pacificus]QCI28768.1 hypothetical protein C6V80_07255 [Caminibacter pacificus]ROR39356.1 Hpt domain-containing protein [Caminibacter pacificus]